MHGLKETLKKILSVSNFKCKELIPTHTKIVLYFHHHAPPTKLSQHHTDFACARLMNIYNTSHIACHPYHEKILTRFLRIITFASVAALDSSSLSLSLHCRFLIFFFVFDNTVNVAFQNLSSSAAAETLKYS